jgi:hypothetical protein
MLKYAGAIVVVVMALALMLVATHPWSIISTVLLARRRTVTFEMDSARFTPTTPPAFVNACVRTT